MGESLALLTALLWSVGVILSKRALDFISPFALNVFKNVLGFLLLAATTIVLGQTGIGSIPTRDLLVMLLSGAIGIGISDTLFFMTLARLGTSRTAVVDCLYSPFVILFSFLILQETLPALAGAGGALILGSVLLSSQRGFGGPISRKQFWTGCALGASSMATVGFAIVLVKPLLNLYPLSLLSTIRMAGGLAVLMVWLPLHSDRNSIYKVFRPQAAWKWMLGGTFFGSYLSLVSWLAGFKYSQAGIVALLNQTSTVLIVVLATVFLKEPMTRLKLAAVLMAFIGTLIVLS